LRKGDRGIAGESEEAKVTAGWSIWSDDATADAVSACGGERC